MSNKVKRLFKDFCPSEYDLKLKVDPDKDIFEGSVVIHGRKNGRPSKRLTFHQKELKIKRVNVTFKSKNQDQQVAVTRFNKHEKFNELRIHSDQLLYPGEYIVDIEFSGKITRPMNGIYPSYFDNNGKTEKIIATQFESHHAREAFPCIDEPEAKAIFNLSLITPKVNTVISNTPVKTQKTLAKNIVTTFEPTPIMSTYLVAFVFGDMEYLEAKTKDGVLVRTYATKNNIKHTEFALKCATDTLEFYNEYFDIPYPLDKCDFIALPDFSSGAMENWGCITFREQALLVDSDNTSLTLKQYVANVVAHELTHQWFGNLVTMRWWTDLWLNESFASWMSYLAVDHLFPEWDVWTQFIVDEQSLALKQDALEYTHPIEVVVRHPDEIRTIFDVISYEKGASVLAMLNNYLGADTFRDGVRLYLKKNSYKNTDTVDLWQALEKSSGRPIKQFMSKWTSTAGYPILNVLSANNSISVRQERFYLNPSADKVESIWPIPLLGSIDLNNNQLLSQKSLLLSRKSSDSPVLFNIGRKGFYRVIYDLDTINLIANNDLNNLSDVDRLGLLSDSFEAAKAGYAPTSDTLELLDSYSTESSVVVWEIIAGIFSSIRLSMNDKNIRDIMKPYVSKFTASKLEELGWDEKPDDSHFDKLLRPIILGLASSADQNEVVNRCHELFNQISNKSNTIPADLRSVVYSTVAKNGSEEQFNKLLELHKTTKSPEERLNLCAALTGFSNQKLISRSLDLIISDVVRLQDVSYWVAYSFMNHHSRDQTWQWLKDNWSWLDKNMGSDLSFSRMPLYAGRCYSSKDFLPEFKEFFESKLKPGFERPLNQAIETIEWQAEWKIRDLENIRQFFS